VDVRCRKPGGDFEQVLVRGKMSFNPAAFLLLKICWKQRNK